MKRFFLFFLILGLCGWSFIRVDRMRQAQAPTPKLMLLPSREMVRVISFGNEILVAQLIFYNSMFYVGSLEKPPEIAAYKDLYHTLDTVTYLDPYNMDGYYFAQGMFSWNRRLIEPLNILLRRGMAYRSWDWHLPFFYGFNQFYFLKNPKEAAIYLKKAYQLDPSNTFLPSLIARLYYQGEATKVAIDYLQEMIRTTGSENMRRWLTVRLEAFRFVALLEEGIVRYQERYKERPQRLQALVDGGILKAIPPDPYGGEFYLDTHGRVRTTSNFIYEQEKQKKSGG